ncbi:MAG: leucine-rich repeat domain-containing protein [Patescibacteria group bacterium]
MERKIGIVLFLLGFMVFGIIYVLFLKGPEPSVVSPEPVTNQSSQNNQTKDAKDSEEQRAINIATVNTLDLSNKGLEKLPSYVPKQTNLEELNLSNNRLIGALPSEIGKLKNLRVLNASNNLMTGVPAEVGQLSKLEFLDLSNNKLTGLPYELGNLENLKVLNLSGNSYATQDLEVIKKSLSPETKIVL